MTKWHSQLLEDKHDTTTFDCGNDTLTRWLQSQALRAQHANTARTRVWTPPGSAQVVAYYSIAPTQIARAELGTKPAGGYSLVPAYLLAKLALDRSLHGQGLGTELLLDALEVLMQASVNAGGRVIVVDAIDESAAAFYQHHDFTPIKDNPRRLFVKVETVHHAFGGGYLQVTEEPQADLVSMVFQAADGAVHSVVASVDEVRRIANRLVTLAEENAGDPNSTVQFRAILMDVLGRDPFAELDDTH